MITLERLNFRKVQICDDEACRNLRSYFVNKPCHQTLGKTCDRTCEIILVEIRHKICDE